MRKEIDPQSSPRGRAFELWKDAPMPKVTITKTFNIGRLVRAGRRRGLKTNMLMCWCIGHAASPIAEFYTLPAGGHLWQYDRLAVNTVVMTSKGEPHLCDIPFSEDIRQFNEDYLRLTRQVHDTNEDRNRRGGERLFRDVHQSLPGLGQIPAGILQDHAARLLPVPPRPDGRLRSRPLPLRPPGGHQPACPIATLVRARINHIKQKRVSIKGTLSLVISTNPIELLNSLQSLEIHLRRCISSHCG